VIVKIEPVSDDAWARGAASLVLSKIFRVPEIGVNATTFFSWT